MQVLTPPTSSIAAKPLSNMDYDMEFDPLYEITDIISSSIAAGLITSVTIDEFEAKTSELDGPVLESYLQTLWDEI